MVEIGCSHFFRVYEMLRLQHFLSLHSHRLLASSNFSLVNKRRKWMSGFGLMGSCEVVRKMDSNKFHSYCTVERDSEFEFDPEKAREALRKLDEQLQYLSEKQINPPKIRASELSRSRNQMTEEMPKFSGSFLAYSAFTLAIFTVFYNVLFLTVIKPSIDGEEPVPAATIITDAPGAITKQLAQEFLTKP